MRTVVNVYNRRNTFYPATYASLIKEYLQKTNDAERRIPIFLMVFREAIIANRPHVLFVFDDLKIQYPPEVLVRCLDIDIAKNPGMFRGRWATSFVADAYLYTLQKFLPEYSEVYCRYRILAALEEEEFFLNVVNDWSIELLWFVADLENYSQALEKYIDWRLKIDYIKGFWWKSIIKLMEVLGRLPGNRQQMAEKIIKRVLEISENGTVYFDVSKLLEIMSLWESGWKERELEGYEEYLKELRQVLVDAGRYDVKGWQDVEYTKKLFPVRKGKNNEAALAKYKVVLEEDFSTYPKWKKAEADLDDGFLDRK